VCAPSAIVVYAVSPFERSAVNSQNFPSKSIQNRSEETGREGVHWVSLVKPIRPQSSSVASGVAGTPETKQKPKISCML